MSVIKTLWTTQCPYFPEHGDVHIKASLHESCIMSCNCRVPMSINQLVNMSPEQLSAEFSPSEGVSGF